MSMRHALVLGLSLAVTDSALAAEAPAGDSPARLSLLVGQWACAAQGASAEARQTPTLITFRGDGTGTSERVMDLEKVAAVKAGKVALVTSFTWQADADRVLLTQGSVDAEPRDDSIDSMISAIALRKELDRVAHNAAPSRLAVLRLDSNELVFDSPKAQRSRITDCRRG